MQEKKLCDTKIGKFSLIRLQETHKREKCVKKKDL